MSDTARIRCAGCGGILCANLVKPGRRLLCPDCALKAAASPLSGAWWWERLRRGVRSPFFFGPVAAVLIALGLYSFGAFGTSVDREQTSAGNSSGPSDMGRPPRRGAGAAFQPGPGNNNPPQRGPGRGGRGRGGRGRGGRPKGPQAELWLPADRSPVASVIAFRA
jgi:hypothetical protein